MESQISSPAVLGRSAHSPHVEIKVGNGDQRKKHRHDAAQSQDKFSPLEQSPAEEMRHFSALDEETRRKNFSALKEASPRC
jgi:hypothetical protein